MKMRYLFPLLALLLLCFGCEDSNKDSLLLEVSQSSFNAISSDGETVEVEITCNGSWTASSNSKKWCNVTPQTGLENQKLTIYIEGNLEKTARTAVVTVTSQGINKEIKLKQEPANTPFDPEKYHYKLPVIFHVLYNDRNNNTQYVKEGRLPEILKRVNELYKHAGANSADMNLEFVLATEDSKGNTLSEPGVERIKWKSASIDMEEFMFTNDHTYNYLIWEPNDYINVMVYTFTDENTLGVSHFPYTPQGYPLEGTETVPYYITGDNLQYAYCISINSTYIYEESINGRLNQNDAAITLAHEIGHYLGLYHTFSEATLNGIEICEDTDYCEDTPTYDRGEYMDWLESLSGNVSFADLAHRYDCQSGPFTARNIMDYSFCYLDEFTQDQKKRVRHILTYSSLIPGPKKGQANTRSTYDGPLDLPIRVMK